MAQDACEKWGFLGSVPRYSGSVDLGWDLAGRKDFRPPFENADIETNKPGGRRMPLVFMNSDPLQCKF